MRRMSRKNMWEAGREGPGRVERELNPSLPQEDVLENT